MERFVCIYVYKEEMDPSISTIGYLSNSSDFTIEIDSSDRSSPAAINLSCSEETDSDMDVSSII